MKDAYSELLETSRIRGLTAQESAAMEALLKRDPQLREDWEAERALNEALANLPGPRPSSNFTQIVMQEISRPLPAQNRVSPWGRIWDGWLRPAAGAVVLVTLTFILVDHRQIQHDREIARLAAEKVEILPSVAVLRDFDVIDRLEDLQSEPDLELLAAFQ